MKLKIISLFITISLTVKCFGQTNYFKIDTVSHGENNFPILNSFKNKLSAEKINQLLQLTELRKIDNDKKKNLFEIVEPPPGAILGGQMSRDYSIVNNNNRSISIIFNISSCGATCYYWNTYYTFNSGNGDLIQLKDLFTDDGYISFINYSDYKKIEKLKTQIEQGDTSVKEDLNNLLAYYKGDLLDCFYIVENSIYLDGENLLPKFLKFEGLDMVTEFELNEFDKYLNEYGKTLFNLNNDSISKFRSTSLPQLFEGKIGKQEILLILDSIDKSASGIYFNKKNRQLISLYGMIENNNLSATLSEINEDLQIIGFIDATWAGDYINGVYLNKDRTKKHTFTAKRK